ncbi:hypothetical protein M1N64_04940 [Peptococcaceae bacterium]|nr:hypothetical protein [Peptococcaceae bacterium]
MLLVANQLKFKVLAVFLVLALVMSMVMMPVGAAQAQYSNGIVLSEPLSEEMVDSINLHGAEIEIVKGSPTIVVGGFDEEIYVPIELTVATMDVLIYGKLVTVEADGNYLLIPLEGEIERTCISEFSVREIKDGQIILEGDINGWFTIVALVIGVVVGVGTILDWVHDNVTTQDAQTIRTNRVIGRGDSTTVRGFDFYVPQPLKGVGVFVNAYDVDRGERVMVSLVGGGHKYTFNEPLLVTGNNRSKMTFFKVNNRELEKMNDLFQRTQGRVVVELKKTCGGGTVQIEEVCVSVNW